MSQQCSLRRDQQVDVHVQDMSAAPDAADEPRTKDKPCLNTLWKS